MAAGGVKQRAGSMDPQSLFNGIIEHAINKMRPKFAENPGPALLLFETCGSHHRIRVRHLVPAEIPAALEKGGIARETDEDLVQKIEKALTEYDEEEMALCFTLPPRQLLVRPKPWIEPPHQHCACCGKRRPDDP